MQLPSLRRRTPPPSKTEVPPRQGYVPGIPLGGVTRNSPSDSVGPTSRRDYMQALLKMYLTCPWSSAAVDAIAKTITAGGLQLAPDVTPEGKGIPKLPPEVEAAQELLDWVNPEDDAVQLMRRSAADLLIFGDTFIEVTWSLGRPVALWSLDVPSMTIEADEHGLITGYRQEMDGNRSAHFSPHEVIHVKLDSPEGGLYGLGPTQKAELVITEWLFAAALVKEVFKQGDPPKLHIDWPLQLQESEIERYSDQHRSRNRGAKNIGNPVETKGGGSVKELQLNRITDYLATLDQKRDEIIAAYHVPPAEVGVIESGNLGGGTGSSQFKMFQTIACQPVAALLLEKLTSKILIEGFGVKGWRARFGEFDWRDDNVVDMIADRRIRNGTWVLNKARQEIGEPPVEGGDAPILVDRQNMVTWTDIAALSKATVANAQAQAVIAQAMNKGSKSSKSSVDDGADTGTDTTTKSEDVPPREFRESWQRRYEAARRIAERSVR